MKNGEAAAQEQIEKEKAARQAFVSTPIDRTKVPEQADANAVNPQGAVQDEGAGEVSEEAKAEAEAAAQEADAAKA